VYCKNYHAERGVCVFSSDTQRKHSVLARSNILCAFRESWSYYSPLSLCLAALPNIKKWQKSRGFGKKPSLEKTWLYMYVPSSKKTKNSKEQIANNATHGYIAFQWSFHRKQNRKQKQNEGEKSSESDPSLPSHSPRYSIPFQTIPSIPNRLAGKRLSPLKRRNRRLAKTEKKSIIGLQHPALVYCRPLRFVGRV
jgi:hypothetical protein